MVTEIARITIDPGRTLEFEAALAEAEPLFRAGKGCTGFALEQVIETPGVYHLIVGWTTVEAHTVDFRATEAFQQWRALVGPFFVTAPHVIHTQTVIGTVEVK